MTSRFASLLLTVLMFTGVQIVPGQQSKRFDPKSYPAGSFHVSSRDYSVGDFTVRIIQAKRVYDSSAPPPSYCRAWLEVRGDGRILSQAYFDDIEPVGGSFGVFLPKNQPLDDYFMALKDGDYDGRLLLIGKDGSLTNLPGGGLFMTSDKRYIIGIHGSDYASPFVIDVVRHQLVIDGEKEKLPGVGDWYRDKIGYFYTEDKEDGQLPDPNQKTVAIRRLDLKYLKVTGDVISSVKLKSVPMVDYEKWQKLGDCGSSR